MDTQLPIDYRSVLKDELNARCEANPRYSLRAFARDLELSPSRLSEILSCKQGLSRKAAMKLTQSLGYSDDESEHFCDLVSIKHARSHSEKEQAKLRLLKRQSEQKKDERFQLQLDAFKIISDWYHLGILELMKTKGFRSESRWIARKLSIPIVQVELAIDRLARVGLVTIKDGEIIATQADGWIPGGIPSESIRKFHRQVLQKAIDAISGQSVEERTLVTHFLTVDKHKLAEASKEIERFQKDFCERFQAKNDSEHESVYCISMQLFKIAEDGP